MGVHFDFAISFYKMLEYAKHNVLVVERSNPLTVFVPGNSQYKQIWDPFDIHAYFKAYVVSLDNRMVMHGDAPMRPC